MIIAIEGNIGAGKSELIAHLQTSLGKAHESIDFFPEPLDVWGETLQMYAVNKRKWASILALDVLRGLGDVKASAKRHQIVERTPYACRYVFTEIDKHDGHIKKEELDVIDQYFELYGWKPDVVLHLAVEEGVCCDRIESRGRPGEERVSYEHVKAIGYYYDKMYQSHFPDQPVIRCVQSQSETMAAYHARLTYLVLRAIENDDQKHRLNDDQRSEHFHNVHQPPGFHGNVGQNRLDNPVQR